jgi:hypothetical protein
MTIDAGFAGTLGHNPGAVAHSGRGRGVPTRGGTASAMGRGTRAIADPTRVVARPPRTRTAASHGQGWPWQ